MHVLRARSNRTRSVLALVLGVVAFVVAACAPPPPLGTVNAQRAAAPQWPLLADPSVMYDSGHYYVFGTNTASNRFPVHVVDSLTQTYSIGGWDAIVQEAMPSKVPWSTGNLSWAPTVAHVGSVYVMFFAADRISPPDPANGTCIGRAVAASPAGPYVAEATPFSCGLGGTGGALDPYLLRDPSGKWWLYAAFGSTESPIYVFGLDEFANSTRGPDGYASFWPVPVYGKHYPWEGRFIENPAMVYDPTTSSYLLTYSAGDWWTPSYSTGLARCATPVGLCVGNPGGPWLSSSSTQTGPGGLSFFTGADGKEKAAYESFAAGTEAPSARRWGTAAGVTLGDAPSLGPP
jgi:hypothetical protein